MFKFSLIDRIWFEFEVSLIYLINNNFLNQIWFKLNLNLFKCYQTIKSNLFDFNTLIFIWLVNINNSYEYK